LGHYAWPAPPEQPASAAVGAGEQQQVEAAISNTSDAVSRLEPVSNQS